MIKTIIDKPNLLDLTRTVTKKRLQDYINELVEKYHTVSYGVNVCDDRRRLYIEFRFANVTYVAYISNDIHRTTCEYGIKYLDSYDRLKTCKPRNIDEYMICTKIATELITAIYEVLSLGELKRND